MPPTPCKTRSSTSLAATAPSRSTRTPSGFYLFATARNACCDLRRRRRDGSLEALQEAGALAEPPAADACPQQHVVDLDARRRLRAALDRLPERQRTAWVLKEFGEFTYEEIAARLEMNTNAVAQLLHRARRGLQASY